MTRRICLDGATKWVETTDVGSGSLIRLHPVQSQNPADVYSVSASGGWTINQNNGADEAFTVIGDFVYVTPVDLSAGSSFGYRWVAT